MKILHVLDHSLPLFSGYAFRSDAILKHQRALGLEPVVLTSPKHGSDRDEVEEIGGTRFYRTAALPKAGVAGRPFAHEVMLMKRLARRIAEVAAAERVEVIHSHSPLLNGLPALRVARRLKVPIVYEARAFWEDAAVDHGTFAEGSARYRISRALETFLFRQADRVVTICEGMRAELISRGIQAGKVTVVPNGVDVAQFQPRPRDVALADRFGLDGIPVFGFIGSFYRYEGLGFLARSFATLAKQVPGARLMLVGGGPEEPSVKELAGGGNGAIILPGRVPHGSVEDYYSLLDVLVFPRERMRLTELVTPLKPLEAMAMSKAVLASDVGGHRELIRHGNTGLLFAAGDERDLIGQAIRLAQDPSLRAELGRNGRRFVEQERSWAKLVERYIGVYEKAKRIADHG